MTAAAASGPAPARPLRVLLVTGSLGPGGTELAVVALARGLAARGRVRPRVAVLARAGRHRAPLDEAAIPLHELDIDGPIRRWRNLRRLARLARLVRDERVDVVHTFLFDADVYGMLAARFGGPRAIVTTRRAIKSNRPHHLRAYRWTNRFVDRIVANSEAVARFTCERERPAPGQVITIPNGVDVERFARGDRDAMRRHLGLEPGQIAVGAVGTIKPVKGQQVLWKAVEPLLAADPRLVLVLAGTVTAPAGEALRSAILASPVSSRVRLPGAVDDVASLLAALDLFVLPSLSEGMSNALLEAMAAGKPIVATTAGGNAECLEGGAGVLVPAGDAGALTEAIAGLLASETERARLGARARRRAAERYALDAAVAAIESLYAELAGRS